MKRMVMKSALSFMALSFCLLGVHSSQAQSRGDASVEEIVQALTPPSKTRSMGRNMKVEAAKIDLTVNFDFDSAKLKEESRPQLERLAEALKADRLANLKFQVEGHTDAQGSSTYNEALSTRRAASVVSFLNQSGIEMQRLQSVGKGSTELLEPSDPKSAKNRRVRILTLEQSHEAQPSHPRDDVQSEPARPTLAARERRRNEGFRSGWWTPDTALHATSWRTSDRALNARC